MNAQPAACPRCGIIVPEDAPGGLCPACLMGGVMETEPLPAHAMPAPQQDLLVRAFPNLEILEPLGAGGMGRVYKVRQSQMDRLAALKVLPPELASDPGWVERFHREARALARLNHPHIVQLFDFGETSDGGEGPKFAYLLMEFVDGVNLRQAMKEGGLTAQEALLMVPKLCDALHYAHEQGVLHRDLKPENILLDSQGGIKIADFGLAKFFDAKNGGKELPNTMLTQSGMQLGTAAYMAPEQVEHPEDVDHRADIYSLGVVFYEMLTGELPLGRFPAPSEHQGVDARLDQVVFRTLEKLRERRYQHANDVGSDVRTIAAAPAPKAAGMGNQPSPSHRGCLRTLVGLVALVVTGIAVLGVLVPWVYLHRRAPSARALEVLPSDELSQVTTRVTVDPSVSTDGQGSLKIEAVQGAVITVGELDSLKVVQGETLWCDAKVKCADAKQGVFLEVWYEMTDGTRKSSKGVEQTRYGTQDWATVRLPVKVARTITTRKLWVNVVMPGGGTAWVDDIRFTAESPSL